MGTDDHLPKQLSNSDAARNAFREDILTYIYTLLQYKIERKVVHLRTDGVG